MVRSSSPQTIAIIGGGFSGSMVAAHLLQTATCPLNIKLIERKPLCGRGSAYTTNFSCHLLNVPAGKMSAFPDDADHFLRWLQRQDCLVRTVKSDTFVSRKIYGEYIQTVLDEAEALAQSNVDLQRLADEAVSIQQHTESATVFLSSGRTIQAHRLVLALGNFPPRDPHVAERSFYNSRQYISNGWTADAIASISPDQPVLLIGSGLTMIDWAVALQKQGHKSVIHVVSRHGLLPHAHASQPTASYPSFLCGSPTSIRVLMRQIRQEIDSALASGYDWRAVIDSMRPEIQAIWQTLPWQEQRRFLRHIRPYWDIHRHRVAAAVADTLSSMLHSGQLVVHAGCIQAYYERCCDVDVVIRKRHSTKTIVLRVSNVINCTGSSCDYRKITHPLIVNLLRSGQVRPDSLALGLDVAPNGALLSSEGLVSKLMYTLGPPKKGCLWETTAVPEIRKQAVALSQELLCG